MITYRKGNLLEHYQEFDIIAHGVNCQGVMASGFAKGLREKFPWAYESYKEFCDLRDEEYLLGTIRWSKSETENIRIAHCFTQLSYGKENFRYVSYDAIDDCMIKLANECIIGETKICMPMIGAGLGQGDWEIIEKIIDVQLKPFDVTVFQL
jgi:O-acetyl-ADP-ribose deacetylase (regulator of RNase III)